MDLSLQLWSIKDETAKDFRKALEFVAECGYSGVEFAGFGDLTADEMKSELEKNNLYSIGSHTSKDLFENALIENLEYNKAIGSKYMIIPHASYETIEDVHNVAKLLNESAKIAKEYGIKIGYHNHAGEFEKFDGKYILDILAEETDDCVILEVDVFWVAKGGECPYEYLRKLGKKAELIHLKQIDDNGENSTWPNGTLELSKIKEAAPYAKYFIVEQEGTAEPKTAAKENVNYLKK
ncbi:MAG: sugar phosphate isomerase/epimerase [Eubacteriales bacterium]|nr:sugar phosphate isomerase/epimerase [Eubacteriales bacterium]